LHRLRDTTLESIAKRSTTYGPAARRILGGRVDSLQKDTRTLTDLTRQIERDNDSVRPLIKDHQQLGASPEDHALDELRRMYGVSE